MAAKKGTKPGQIAIAWVRAHSGKDGLPLITPILEFSTAAGVEENARDVTLKDVEFREIKDILSRFTPVGGWYGGPGCDTHKGVRMRKGM